MNVIVGVDEVGRGPWAGPLVAAAVIWGSSIKIKKLTDSKKLSHKQRLQLSEVIKCAALDIGIGWASPVEIDKFGLTRANQLAMLRALEPLNCDGLEIIIDGKVNYLAPKYKCTAIIKADATVPAVSAASIIAKVARDNYMQEMSKLYPEYGFESHVGYGTKHHIQQLNLHGLSPLHRMLFKPVSKLNLV